MVICCVFFNTCSVRFKKCQFAHSLGEEGPQVKQNCNGIWPNMYQSGEWNIKRGAFDSTEDVNPKFECLVLSRNM